MCCGEREDVGDRRVVMGLHDDRPEAGLARESGGLGRVDPPRKRRRRRMNVEVDRPLEDSCDAIGAHAAASLAFGSVAWGKTCFPHGPPSSSAQASAHAPRIEKEGDPPVPPHPPPPPPPPAPPP